MEERIWTKGPMCSGETAFMTTNQSLLLLLKKSAKSQGKVLHEWNRNIILPYISQKNFVTLKMSSWLEYGRSFVNSKGAEKCKRLPLWSFPWGKKPSGDSLITQLYVQNLVKWQWARELTRYAVSPIWMDSLYPSPTCPQPRWCFGHWRLATIQNDCQQSPKVWVFSPSAQSLQPVDSVMKREWQFISLAMLPCPSIRELGNYEEAQIWDPVKAYDRPQAFTHPRGSSVI